MDKIEPGLAVAIAGQVSIGLTPGDGQKGRQRAALMAIGLMLLTATDQDELVQDVLAMSEKARISVSGDGVVRIEPWAGVKA